MNKITITFDDKEDLERFIFENLPLCVMTIKKSKTPFIDPFKSQIGREICIGALVDAFVKHSK